MDEVREYWDRQARWNALVAIYDSPAVRDAARAEQAFERSGHEAARHLARFVHPESRVLDLGCGIGRVVRPLAPHCREIVGLDVSGEMLQRAGEYLRGVPNARTLRTDGASLAGVADGSVDFLYSLLCFIHVDKVSATRYFAEIERVLAPGAFAFLQFEDAESPEGAQRRADHAGRSDPLEFYAAEELHALLAAAELEPTDVLRSGGYHYVTAVRRAEPDWRARFRDAVSVSALELGGAFDDVRFDPARAGWVGASIEVRAQGWWTVAPVFALTPEGAGPDGMAHFRAQAVAPLRGPGAHTVELRRDGDGSIELEIDGRPAPWLDVRVGPDPPTRACRLHAGLLPRGLRWEPSTLRDFPGYFGTRAIALGA